jgi:hypothetical protein
MSHSPGDLELFSPKPGFSLLARIRNLFTSAKIVCEWGGEVEGRIGSEYAGTRDAPGPG